MVAKTNRTTIVLRPDIRDGLKHIARKDQTYNELFLELIKLHNEHVNNQKEALEGSSLNQEPSQDQTQNLQSNQANNPRITKEVEQI